MAIYSAVIDACVLVPVSLADTHLRLAEKLLFRPIWSDRILAEASAALAAIHPHLDASSVERRVRFMNEAFPDARIDEFGDIESGLVLPDPDDRHVLAAAIRAHADAVITANLRDFPRAYIDELGIEVVSPDEFLLNQLDMASRIVIETLREQAAATRHPPLSVEDVLGALARAGAPEFADEVARRL